MTLSHSILVFSFVCCYTFSTRIDDLENERFFSTIKTLKEENVSIVGYYHISSVKKYWKEVVSEQLHLISGMDNKGTLIRHSSLITLVDLLAIYLAGSPQDKAALLTIINSKVGKKHHTKLKVVLVNRILRDTYKNANSTEKSRLRVVSIKDMASEGEYSAISSLHSHCKEQVQANRKTFVFYIHSKGADQHVGAYNPVAFWRDYMNDHILRYPSSCIRSLLLGYVACGVDYSYSYQANVAPHYSGNFWWADCNHIAALPGLWDPINNAWACEMFLFNVSQSNAVRDMFGGVCAYNLHTCGHGGGSLYFRHCKRFEYLSELRNRITSDKFSEKLKGGHARAQSLCPTLYRQPYLSQIDLITSTLTKS